MRQIKFRAWDIYLKRFRDEMDYVVDPDTGLPHWIHDNEYLQGVAEQLILNQFTGLLDKNGKEVYEGDIVRWSDWEGIEIGTISGRYEVKWNPDKYSLQFYDPFNNEWYGFDEAVFDEIIGNIYEHSDLLP